MGLFSKLGSLFTDGVVKEASDSYQAKVNADVTKVTEQLTADSQWEQAEIANSGWKDEYVLLLLSIPLILAFVPYTAQAVLNGFSVLAMTPQWYRWLVLIVFTAIYGVRVWRR